MSRHLEIHIDPEVFKLRDPKVLRMLAGKMPVEVFVALLQPSDPYVLIGDTVYAYTEKEYYASRGVMMPTSLTDEDIEYILNLDDLGFMSESDRNYVLGLKDESCPVCKRSQLRNTLSSLVKKYNIQLPDKKKPHVVPFGEYPECDGVVQSKIPSLLSHMYKLPYSVRKPCMDCVQKHLSQAWILSQECSMGYPEHIAYVVGHLGEALDELPPEMTALHDTVEFCLAKTCCDQKPFVPLGSMMGHIRSGMAHAEEDDVPVEETKFEIEFTPDMRRELEDAKGVIPALFKDVLSNFTLRVENSDKMQLMGSLAVAADSIATIAPLTANMLRARRLVFSAGPDLMEEAGYGVEELLEVVSRE